MDNTKAKLLQELMDEMSGGMADQFHSKHAPPPVEEPAPSLPESVDLDGAVTEQDGRAGPQGVEDLDASDAELQKLLSDPAILEMLGLNAEDEGGLV